VAGMDGGHQGRVGGRGGTTSGRLGSRRGHPTHTRRGRGQGGFFGGGAESSRKDVEDTASMRAISDAASELSSPGISPRDATTAEVHTVPESRVHQASRSYVGRPRQRSDPTRQRSRQSPMVPMPPRGHATPDDDLPQLDGGGVLPPPPPPAACHPEGLSIQAMYQRIRELEEQFVCEGGTHEVRHWTVDQIQAATDRIERERPPAPDAERMRKSSLGSPPGVAKSPPREFLKGGRAVHGFPITIDKLPSEHGSEYCSDDSGSMPSSPRSARSVGSGSGSAFGSVARKRIGRSRSKRGGGGGGSGKGN
jgi:hypothetical protein